MVFASLSLFSDFYQNQNFKRIFMMTLLCVIYCKPLQRNTNEPLSDLKTENALLDVEKQRIISELKSKLLARLKLDYLPPTDETFSWDTVPEEMKAVFNEELENENSETENDEAKSETIISPLIKSNSCNRNQSINRECFYLSIPVLNSDDITSAKLLVPLISDIDTGFRNVLKYNLSVNLYKMVYDLSIGNKENGNVEIDILNTFKEITSNDLDISNPANGTLVTLSIDVYPSNLRIDQIIHVSKMVLEIQYRATVVKRSKRSSNISICQPNQYFCCRQSMRIDIQKLELMRYIVAPRFFIINYCKGDCNNYVHYSSNHANALNFLRGQDVTTLREMRPCCVPYTFSSQKIMYIAKDRTLHAEIFNDLSAASCGCL